MTSELMTSLLLVYMLGIAAIAVLYLRTRSLSMTAYVGWGLLAVMVPLVGPFAVLLIRPGKREK